MEIAEFVIIARGGQFVQPYTASVKLTSDDPDFADFIEDEPACTFDDWCDVALNDLVDDLEQYGAAAVVLSLEEYRELPKY
jgi:hypothetical protein